MKPSTTYIYPTAYSSVVCVLIEPRFASSTTDYINKTLVRDIQLTKCSFITNATYQNYISVLVIGY